MYNCTTTGKDPIDLVLDTSAVLAVLLNEPVRSAILERTRGANLLAAPSLPWELGNALAALVRRGGATPRDALRVWAAFLRIPVRYVAIDVPDALGLAVRHRLYAYDAYVLQAARAQDAPLLSLDDRQSAAGRAAGIELLEVDG
jgi:predicted nucleic acid-binding protein